MFTTLSSATSAKLDLGALRRLSKEATWIVFGQAAAVGGALVGVRVLTRLLEPAQYGYLALGLTLATLVNQVIMAPLIAGASRFYAPAAANKALGDFFTVCRRFMIAATAAVGLLTILCVAGLLAFGAAQWISLAVATSGLALLNGYSGAVNSIQTAARHRSIVAVHDAAYSWLRFILATVLIVCLGGNSTTAVLGFTLAALLVLVSQLMFLRRVIGPQVLKRGRTTAWQAQMWDYSWPFASWGIFTWAQFASDRWALQTFASTHEVGLYAVLFQLGYYPILLTVGMATQFLGPIFFQRAGDGSDSMRNANVHDLAWRIVRLSLGLTAIAFAVAWLLHARIFQVFAAKEYAEISALLPWEILAGGLFGAGQTLALKLMSELRSRTLVAVKIGSAVIGIAANLLGAYGGGIAGLVAAGVLSSAVYFLAVVLLAPAPKRRQAA